MGTRQPSVHRERVLLGESSQTQKELRTGDPASPKHRPKIVYTNKRLNFPPQYASLDSGF